jgi:hypothetical protein
MRVIWLGFIVAALSFGSAQAWDQAAMNAQVDATDFLLDNDCSATLVAKDELLTANHCVVEQFRTVKREEINDKGEVKNVEIKIAAPGTASRIDFAGPNETRRTSYTYKVLAHDSERDLALVKTAVDIVGKPAPLACAEPKRGDKVWAVGNPHIVLYATISTGIVNSVNRDYRGLGVGEDILQPEVNDNNGLVQHTALISEGSSGGALYNDNGELIGVNVLGSHDGWGFAVPLSEVRKFLEDNGAAEPCP